MTEDIAKTLTDRFGLPTFRQGQGEAILGALAGRDQLVVMPTGAGKSLVYQLASLHLPGVTLVVSPLIALMKDQVDVLTRRGIAATFINSAIGQAEQDRRLAELAKSTYRMLYVAPERLRSVRFLQALRHVQVSLLAVDEAHCVSEWGHDFRPDYLHLGQARLQMGSPTTAALTATATPRVQDDIVKLLGIASAERMITGFNRPNLTFEVHYTSAEGDKLSALMGLLSELNDGGAIIYTGTRRDAAQVAAFVRETVGMHAEHYHAGLAADRRTWVQDAYLSGQLPVVAATNAFGMGIDRPDVRQVIHFSMPGTLEAYYQEAGRAGRDGRPARAALLYAPEDRSLQEFFIEQGSPSMQEAQELHRAISALGSGNVWTTLDDLSLSMGSGSVKLKLAMAQLEQAGTLRHLGDDGVRMLIHASRWRPDAMVEIQGRAEARRQYRLRQLAQMIAYAESNACRRRILLDHFGDRGPATAERCCDNCLTRQRIPVQAREAGDVAALPLAARAGLIILDTVRRIPHAVGRTKIASILSGSRAKSVTSYGYDKLVYYGKLGGVTQDSIRGLIDQLVAQGYLKVVGGRMPVVRLTPRGEAALAERAPVPIELPRDAARKIARARRRHAEGRSPKEDGPTVSVTAHLLAYGTSPEEIAAQRGLKLWTIFGHIATLIEQGRVPLDAMVPEEIAAVVRRAIAEVGDAQRLAPIKERLPAEITYGQVRCVVADWRRQHPVAESKAPPARAPASTRPPSVPSAADRIRAFLAGAHPQQLDGPWATGWALGFHSRFAGAAWQRTDVGELAYRLKYQADRSAIEPLVERALALIQSHRELADADALVPMPPSTPRELDPVQSWAEGLGQALGKPILSALVKQRRTQPQKEMHTMAQKRDNVSGAYRVRAEARGRRLLVLDDLYDSGATLQEVTRALTQAGALRVSVLTMTRTIHDDA